MTPGLLTKRSGVAWVVLWVREVPVVDQHGRPVASPWNPRVQLRAPRIKEIDTVRASCREEAQFRARQRFKHDRANQIQVQAQISREIGDDDAEIVRRQRIPPSLKSTTRRRTVHAQTAA